MSEPVDCDHENPGVAEAIRGMSADQVQELVEEARASELRRALEDVQAVVAAWREFTGPPTLSKGAT